MKCATFIAENYPAEMRVPNPETDLTKEQSLLWHRILYKKGWIAPSWPKEYGGPGWTITQRYIFEQETSRAGTLPPLPFGVTMVGPVIYTFGNDAQKKKFLAADPVRRRLVVPGLFRARRRLRPCLIAHQGGAGSATTTSSMGTRPGPRSRSTQTGYFVWSAPTRRPRLSRASRSC